MGGRISRRQFLEGVIATSAALYSPVVAAESRRLRHLTDRVKLGKSGIEVSYLGFGTGTKGWNKESNQTRVGIVKFARMVNHAYDLGINYFDVADIYGTHSYLRAALRRKPRESYVIQTKLWYRTCQDAWADIDRFRQELETDYIDILMIHCVDSAAWPVDLATFVDTLHTAKEKGIIRAHGMSFHSLKAMSAVPENPFVEVALTRINHAGAKMDGTVSEVLPVIRKIHDAGRGVVGIKILGEGTIADSRHESLAFVLGLDFVDAVVIGFESAEQVDDIVRMGNEILAE